MARAVRFDGLFRLGVNVEIPQGYTNTHVAGRMYIFTPMAAAEVARIREADPSS